MNRGELRFLLLRYLFVNSESLERSFHYQLVEEYGRKLNLLPLCLPRSRIPAEHLPDQFLHLSTSFDCHDEYMTLDVL